MPWELAVKYVERHRGWHYGRAAKAVDDACASGELRNEWRPRYPEPDDGPDAPDREHVVYDLWLDPPKPTPLKRAKIKAWLYKKFHGQRVPDDCVRKDLLNELRGSDPLLKSCDDATFKTAFDEYHADLSTNAK
jgi:hypothetical protein